MDELPNLKEYKNAIYRFGYLFMYRLLRPWLRLPFTYKFSRVSREFNETVRILHNVSSDIIEQRKQYFEKVGISSYSAKKRMALMDLLLKAQKEQDINIDDEGIREEVDTFMFEVKMGNLRIFIVLIQFKFLILTNICYHNRRNTSWDDESTSLTDRFYIDFI